VAAEPSRPKAAAVVKKMRSSPSAWAELALPAPLVPPMPPALVRCATHAAYIYADLDTHTACAVFE
jgi:hypothetical protein